MRALVTGGTGFVGANLVRELLVDGDRVRVLARPGGDRRALEGCDVEIAEGDLLDAGSVRRAVAGMERVFHVAADYRLWAPDPAALFRANVDGSVVVIPPGGSIPPATLVMPRRDFGPIISLNAATGAALSVQYVGNGPTQEIEAFLLINRARNLDDFKNALQRFDVGAQNFVYIDVHGNIAYFTSGEIPVREDLQAGTVNGVPPIRMRRSTIPGSAPNRCAQSS